MRDFVHAIVILVFSITTLHVTAQQLPSGFTQQLLAENLDPTDMVIGPNGRIYITIKSGKILIVDNDVLLPNPFLTIEVDNFNERGLGHMVLDPDFENNNYYYVFYTVKNTNRNRVSRFTANGDYTLAGSEVVLLDLDPMAGSIHNAGAMVFGPDGKLFVSTGDGANSATAQQLNSLLGKILRINKDGTIPTDNPFYNTATGNNRAIYALGLRNPYSMDIQPGTGKIFTCDVGQSNWEEVNEIIGGKNYGWPLIEGKRTTETPPQNYMDPFYAYSHSQGCAIVGSSFYNPVVSTFPASYTGKFFFADYCGGYIKQLDPVTAEVFPFITGINRPLVIRTANDGSLYYIARAGQGGGSEGDNTSSNNGSLFRVAYSGSGTPFISSHPKNNLVPVGEDAVFFITASGNEPLSYQWQENGVDIPGATQASYTKQNPQITDSGKGYRCSVTNSQGNAISNSASLTVTTNTRPVPVITSPTAGAKYNAGQTLQLAGSAMDNEDGTIPADQLLWKIDFHHGTHTHPALSPTAGSTAEYAIPQIGETSDNVWYRVYLTATDGDGLTKTVHTDVLPNKSTITLQSQPAGLKLNLDGQPVITPFSVTSVVGIMRTLEAPLIQSSGNSHYVFNAWSAPGLNRQFNFTTTASDQSFNALYDILPVGDGDGIKGYYYSNQSRTFTGEPTLVRTDPTINFEWGGGSPAAQISSDNFTVRWRGEIMAQFTDTYTFSTISDDGIRLWINDVLIIDKWIPQGPTEWTGTMALTAGERYPLTLEYFEDGGGAVVKLSWQTSILPKQIIPTSQLFTELITGVEHFRSSALRVFPIPADQHITLERDENISAIDHWVIYSTLGKMALEGTMNSPKQLVDVSSMAEGLYLLKVNSLSHPIRIIKR